MFVCARKQLSQKLSRGAWRAFSSEVEKEPYWKARFPDGVKSFDDIPTVTEKYDTRKLPEVYEGWFKKYGYVVKELVAYGRYTVHAFHFDDFRTVYKNDGNFPIRHSHHIVAEYRRERKHLYDNVGLGPGQGEDWKQLRVLTPTMYHFKPSSSETEKAVDDLIEIIKNNMNDKGEIELKPWLHRWTFESIGLVALNRRLNALSKNDELADKMVQAAARADELIALTTMDPITDYAERKKQFDETQDFFCGVLRKIIDEIKTDIEIEPEKYGVVQNLFRKENCTENDAITLVTDLFHGSLTTVPLTALMALYNVACNPKIQAEAREEIKQIIPTKGAKYYDSKIRMRFTRKIISETLRLNPPIIGNGRVTQKDLVLGGYTVPAFTNVILHYQVACRQEENYKDALSFIPERADHRVDFIFGGSGRVCPGRSFALYQLYLVFAKILRNFEVSYDGGEVKMVNKLHNIPENPLVLRLKPIED